MVSEYETASVEQRNSQKKSDHTVRPPSEYRRGFIKFRNNYFRNSGGSKKYPKNDFRQSRCTLQFSDQHFVSKKREVI